MPPPLAIDVTMDDLGDDVIITTPEPMDLDREGQDPDSDPGSSLDGSPDPTIYAPLTGNPVIIDSDDSDSNSDDDWSETLRDRKQTASSAAPREHNASGTDPEHREQAGMFFL